MIQSRLKVLIAEKEIADDRKWTYENIKQATGVNVTGIHKLARGTAKLYAASTLDALCRFFDCQVGDILVYVPDEPKDEEA
jgi:putative transcriptional regulator